MDGLSVAELARMALGGSAVVAGLALAFGGGVGLLRFPDLYTRLHAAALADGAGAVLVLIGLLIAAPDADVALRLALLAALVAAASPSLTQLVAGAAHAAGLAPIAGKYTAPRPGAKRGGGGS